VSAYLSSRFASNYYTRVKLVSVTNAADYYVTVTINYWPFNL